MQGPDSFRVHTKDGRILIYGGSADSLIMARNGRRNSWLLRRIEDRAGNTIVINYYNEAEQLLVEDGLGVVRPKVISYTGHGATLGNREVVFNYETRPDKEAKFHQGGVGTLARERLSAIATFVAGKSVKNYRLHYSETNRSQVDEITECEGAGNNKCKTPTKFEYEKESGFVARPVSANIESAAQLDVDGNGIPDYFETVATSSGVPAHPEIKAAQYEADIAVAIIASGVSGGAGFAVVAGYNLVKAFAYGLLAGSAEIDYTRNIYLGTGNREGLSRAVLNVQGIPCPPRTPLIFVDYDQDGKDDIVGICRDSSGFRNVYVALSVGDGSFRRFPNATDPVLQLAPFLDTSVDRASAGGPAPVMFDADGDALQDLALCMNPQTLAVFRRTSPSAAFEQPRYFSQSSNFFCGKQRPTYMFFDVDGDGTTEWLVRANDGWKVARYHADGALTWEPIEFKDWWGSEKGRGLMLGDLNGDGLTDVWSSDLGTTRDHVGNQTVTWLNAGSGRFIQRPMHRDPTGPGLFERKRAALLDYDGNGLLDILDHSAFKTNFGGWGEALDSYDNRVWRPKPDFSSYFPPVEATSLVGPFGGQGRDVPVAINLVTDVDGDGNPDVYTGNNTVMLGSGLHNRMLSRVVDGLGNYVSIKYDGAESQGNNKDWYVADCTGRAWPETCLKNMHGLVTGSTEGVMDGATETAERVYTYRYRNGRMNVTGHGWLGFESRKVSVTGAGTDKSVTTEYWPPIRTGLKGEPKVGVDADKPPYLYPYAGLVRSVTIDENTTRRDSSSPLEKGNYGHRRRSRIENHWTARESAEHTTFAKLDSRTTTVFEREGQVFEPEPDLQDGSVLYSCAESFELDDGYGNVGRHSTDCREGNGRPITFERADTEIVPNPATWTLSNPMSVSVTAARSRNFSGTRRLGFGYYPNGLLASVTRGDESMPDTYRSTTYIRDPYGNVASVIEEARSWEQPRQTDIEYDSSYVYPARIINPLGHAIQLRYDERWGTVETTIDANNIVSKASYDAFGLQRSTTTPSGTTTYQYTSVPPESQTVTTPVGVVRPRVRMVRNKENAGLKEAPLTLDLDYRGRVVRAETQGLGTKIVQDRRYNAYGQLVQSTLPYSADSSATPPSMEFRYDGLGRVTLERRSDGGFVEHQYASAASLRDDRRIWLRGLDCRSLGPDEEVLGCAAGVELTIDETSRQNVIVTDYQGLPIRNVDGQNIDTVERTTDYVYGGFGELLSILGTVRSHFEYDDYGRLVTRRGHDFRTESVIHYNGYDEVTTTQDAKYQTRSYEYDVLGRPTLIVDPGERLTQWIYDQGPNAQGRLTSSISPPTPENEDGQRVNYVYEPYVPGANRGAL